MFTVVLVVPLIACDGSFLAALDLLLPQQSACYGLRNSSNTCYRSSDLIRSLFAMYGSFVTYVWKTSSLGMAVLGQDDIRSSVLTACLDLAAVLVVATSIFMQILIVVCGICVGPTLT